MMAMPTGPGAAGRKFVFFKLLELEPHKYQAKVVSFVKDEAVLAEIDEKVKAILKEAGELLETDLSAKIFVFRVPEENRNAFMESAMQQNFIFRF